MDKKKLRPTTTFHFLLVVLLLLGCAGLGWLFLVGVLTLAENLPNLIAVLSSVISVVLNWFNSATISAKESLVAAQAATEAAQAALVAAAAATAAANAAAQAAQHATVRDVSGDNSTVVLNPVYNFGDGQQRSAGDGDK